MYKTELQGTYKNLKWPYKLNVFYTCTGYLGLLCKDVT